MGLDRDEDSSQESKSEPAHLRAGRRRRQSQSPGCRRRRGRAAAHQSRRRPVRARAAARHHHQGHRDLRHRLRVLQLHPSRAGLVSAFCRRSPSRRRSRRHCERECATERRARRIGRRHRKSALSNGSRAEDRKVQGANRGAFRRPRTRRATANSSCWTFRRRWSASIDGRRRSACMRETRSTSFPRGTISSCWARSPPASCSRD